MDVCALLEEVAHSRGMSWLTSSCPRRQRLRDPQVAQRRNCNGREPSAAAQIAAFLDILEDKGVADPAQWMEMNLPLPTGYHIRPLDLYIQGHADALLELVEQRQAAEQILDVTIPGWRDGRSDFEIFIDVDGQRSLRRRGE